MKSIAFWPERNMFGDMKSKNRQAADNRMLTLFGSLKVSDPMRRSITVNGRSSVNKNLEAPSSFKLEPSEFLARARQKPPREPQPTASGFSAWLYSLYSRAYGDNQDRERGKEVEQDVLDRRRRATLCNDNEFLRGISSAWELVHNGIQPRADQPPHNFEVDHLRVGGIPLRASPDLIYHNADLSKVVIVEIKYTTMDIPTNLWPNVWGQLWCYSQLNLAIEAQTVCVVGEVWSDSWTPGYRGHRGGWVQGIRLISLRASVQRNPRAPRYDRFFRELFSIYSGS